MEIIEPMMVPLTYLLILAGLLLLGFIAINVYVGRKIKRFQHQLHNTQQKFEDVAERFEQIEQQLHEIRSGSQSSGRKLKELMLALNRLEEKHQQLTEQDPQDRFYLKGAKLIASGASLEDVMHECDLPRAEAELLFSLHQR